jgi:hypothetical protein
MARIPKLLGVNRLSNFTQGEEPDEFLSCICKQCGDRLILITVEVLEITSHVISYLEERPPSWREAIKRVKCVARSQNRLKLWQDSPLETLDHCMEDYLRHSENGSANRILAQDCGACITENRVR